MVLERRTDIEKIISDGIYTMNKRHVGVIFTLREDVVQTL